MRLPPPHSLRTRLLWFLLSAIVVTALAQALFAYRTARSEADDIFDYHMQQMALSLRSGLPSSGLSSGSEDPQDGDGNDFVVQVWTSDGLRVFQSARTDLPRRTVFGFSDVQARGTTYRVFSMQAGPQIIQVAQDMAARRDMAGTLALRTLAPIALMAPVLMLLVWWVVSSSLAPVARARRQVAERQADDLGEIGESGLPDEIRPLVQELNLLFGRVRQAFEVQKSFVADAAHELRSPLAALKLQAQGLRRATDDAARDLAVTRLTAGIDRASRLVDQLLVLARHQAGAASGLMPERTTLAEIVRQAVADVAAGAQARLVDVGVLHADETPMVAHAEALRILVRNLLDNAIKYTPKGGTVDVETRTIRSAGDQPAGIRLSVEDSGPGIPEADRDRVLDRFYRVAGSTATGSGLGLAIVKSIAELHHAGVLLSRSERLGGLRVQVDFPASAWAAAN